MEYTFTLRYRLSDTASNVDDLIERLGAEGCTDAVVGTGQAGRLALEFTREASSAQAALRSALSDVRRAIGPAKLVEAGPDFVGLTDIADVVGVSRQGMRKLMITHSATFPVPVHEGTTSLWHLVDVLRWMTAKGGYDLAQSVVETAQAAQEINLAKGALQLSAKSARELKLLVA